MRIGELFEKVAASLIAWADGLDATRQPQTSLSFWEITRQKQTLVDWIEIHRTPAHSKQFLDRFNDFTGTVYSSLKRWEAQQDSRTLDQIVSHCGSFAQYLQMWGEATSDDAKPVSPAAPLTMKLTSLTDIVGCDVETLRGRLRSIKIEPDRKGNAHVANVDDVIRALSADPKDHGKLSKLTEYLRHRENKEKSRNHG